MNRRELLAGLGSAGALAGAGTLLRVGPPSFGADGPEMSDGNESLEVETIDARGSEAGTVRVPTDAVALVTFFVTGCGNCQAQIPELAAARDQLRERHGDAVRFLAATYQRSETLSPAALREWWATHGGDWAVGYDAGLAEAYGVVGYPTTILVDPNGEKRWHETAVLDHETIVRDVDDELEAEDSDGDRGEEDPSDETTSESTASRIDVSGP
ncbi:TlpA family protein disulfide reductase [Haloterrigena salifodinae]|uniref:TlpA family protein disulfide reductase n=1 Tax=Haloterrigena salifodinae TaxID=2675099 RepID=A0A8T8E2I1_9EURY|nr:TlpA disulfide reductase family protein [Haloterrigena salifodinae]QRV15591.1 TlpA family protein disulfide reductase [Haloterrigena salifodinae]